MTAVLPASSPSLVPQPRLIENGLGDSLRTLTNRKLDNVTRIRMVRKLRDAASVIEPCAPSSQLVLTPLTGDGDARRAAKQRRRAEVEAFFVPHLGVVDARYLAGMLWSKVTGVRFVHCPRDRFITLLVEHD